MLVSPRETKGAVIQTHEFRQRPAHRIRIQKGQQAFQNQNQGDRDEEVVPHRTGCTASVPAVACRYPPESLKYRKNWVLGSSSSTSAGLLNVLR